MFKPEFLVTPLDVQHIEELCEIGADAFLIGTEGIGLRLPSSFNLGEIKQACEIKDKHNKKLYVAINGIYHNQHLPVIAQYLNSISALPVDGIVFGDPSVLMYRNQLAPTMPMHWSTETTGTNWFSCNYWGQLGAKRAVLAKEISLDAVTEIKSKAKVEIEVQVQGMTSMFHSKRDLLDNYYKYQGKDQSEFKNNYEDQLFLVDRERNTKYPIYQDQLGTHIMSPMDVTMIHELDTFIDEGIDALKFDGIFKSRRYISEITKLYREAIDLYVHDPKSYDEKRDHFLNKVKELQPREREIDYGFFFKETVY